MSTRLRLVIAEDGALLREGLTAVLDRLDFEVCRAVGDGEALVQAVAEDRPDLVVTDIRMPPDFTHEGLRAAIRIREDHPGLPIVALSQYVELSYADQLLSIDDGQGVGYLLKDRIVDVEDFAATLRVVAAGGTVVDPTVVRQILRRNRDPLARLTPREREVLALIAEGQSNASIAASLVVSEAAVGKHIGNILAKLDLPETEDGNRRVLAVLAYLRGTSGVE